MKMKIRSLFVVISIAFGNFVVMVEPTQAIFGLSKCEKVAKSIEQEEAIGYELWKGFDAARDLVARKSSLKEGLEALTLIVPVLNSKVKVYDIIDKNKTCFSAKKVASARNLKTSTVSNVKTLSKIREYIPANPAIKDVELTPALWDGLRVMEIYSKFSSQK